MFASTVLQDFEVWDADHDGALSAVEIDRAALDARFRGPDAAALAALHGFLAAAKEQAPRLDRHWFESYRPVRFVLQKGTPPEDAKRMRKAYAATPGSLQSQYTAALRLLKKSGNELLFNSGGPEFTDIRQGALGDCYMLAPLGAFVHRDPGAIRHMVTPSVDGRDEGYIVHFGDGKDVRVSGLTQAELAMGGSQTGGGLWIRVVEKAYGSRDFKEDDVKIARDGMNGGHPPIAGKAFTGHAFTAVRLEGNFKKEPEKDKFEALLKRVRTDLSQALSERRLVLAATPSAEMPKSINGKHAYAIFGFDLASDRITLWNPHGNDFSPRGPEGVENGFARKDGVFTIPLALFAQAFSRVYFEKAG